MDPIVVVVFCDFVYFGPILGVSLRKKYIIPDLWYREVVRFEVYRQGGELFPERIADP
jgi:hypothetical protein